MCPFAIRMPGKLCRNDTSIFFRDVMGESRRGSGKSVHRSVAGRRLKSMAVSLPKSLSGATSYVACRMYDERRSCLLSSAQSCLSCWRCRTFCGGVLGSPFGCGWPVKNRVRWIVRRAVIQHRPCRMAHDVSKSACFTDAVRNNSCIFGDEL